MVGETEREVPKAAVWLGYSGLIPFVVLTLVCIFGGAYPYLLAVEALRGYGACILSFMGAIHWGLAIHPAAQDPSLKRLGLSVVPPLVAWASLLTPHPATGLLIQAFAFALLLSYDLSATREGRAPAWYPKLRVPLTGVVAICLVVAGFV